jgi:hypothetical protein
LKLNVTREDGIEITLDRIRGRGRRDPRSPGSFLEQPQGEERAFQRLERGSSLSAWEIRFVWDNLAGFAGAYATSNDTVLTGTRAAPTAPPGSNADHIATTAFVMAALSTLRTELTQ